MKKYCIAAALSMACLAPVAQADTVLGLYVVVDGWKADNDGSFSDNNNALQNFNFEDETFVSYYAALEHPVPLVPNLKLKYTELELTGATRLEDTFSFNGSDYIVGTDVNSVTDLSHIDYILYYEIFDNDLISIDLGINAKQFDGELVVTGTSQQGGANFTEIEAVSYTHLTLPTSDLV